MLRVSFLKGVREAGCDEAGRGCLAGPVFAAAVILPAGFRCEGLNDSKKLSPARRGFFRKIIEEKAEGWAVATASEEEIDRLNILRASILAMHRAVEGLCQSFPSNAAMRPGLLLIDGNRFFAYKDIPHRCVVGGDGKFQSIAAASILAKTHRDEYMEKIHERYPAFFWKQNKGYPTPLHRLAIARNGVTPHHRKSFRLL